MVNNFKTVVYKSVFRAYIYYQSFFFGKAGLTSYITSYHIGKGRGKLYHNNVCYASIKVYSKLTNKQTKNRLKLAIWTPNLLSILLEERNCL